MNAQDYIKQQRRRRRKTAALVGAVMLFTLAVVLVVARVLGEPTNVDIPEPGVNTTPPDQYPTLAAHAVTMAGYDFSDEDRPIILLSDPADNSIAGKTHDFDPTPTHLPLVTDGRWWFVDYPGEAIGCIYAAIIVRVADQDDEEAPNQWDLPRLPDLSQNAVEAWGESYCAPTAAANIVWMLGEDYPPLAPASVFGLMQDATPDECANRLVGGIAPPIPALGSLASLMGTEKMSGTVLQDAASGLGVYLRENDTVQWAVNDPELIPRKSFMETLKNESARGSGIVLLLHWGNLKMAGDEDGRSILVVLERNAEQSESQIPEPPEQQQTESAKPVTIEDISGEGEELEPTEIIEGAGGESGGGANDVGLSKEDIMERLKDVKAGSGDIQLSLAWNNYNDLDLSCNEPDGTVIDFEHRRSSSGGNLDVDMNATPQSKRPVENIFWPLGQARRGKYQVYANYYRRHTSSREKIEFTLRVVVGEKEQFYKAKLSPKSGRVLIHTFEYK